VAYGEYPKKVSENGLHLFLNFEREKLFLFLLPEIFFSTSEFDVRKSLDFSHRPKMSDFFPSPVNAIERKAKHIFVNVSPF
jgi:hypothetical protein